MAFLVCLHLSVHTSIDKGKLLVEAPHTKANDNGGEDSNEKST